MFATHCVDSFLNGRIPTGAGCGQRGKANQTSLSIRDRNRSSQASAGDPDQQFIIDRAAGHDEALGRCPGFPSPAYQSGETEPDGLQRGPVDDNRIVSGCDCLLDSPAIAIGKESQA